LLDDIRLSFRTLRQNPGFTAVAVTMLALGIGVNATIFTVTNAVLFKGFPGVAGNDRILYMSTFDGCCVSYPDFLDWRAQAKSFEGMAVVHGINKIFVDRGGFPETVYTTEVSANTFQLAGTKPILGRDFTHADEVAGAPGTAILRYGFWERWYAKDPAVIGRAVRINGSPATIIGVMPPGFSFPQNEDLWVPLEPTARVLDRANRDTWFVFGQLREGVTRESARAEMETIGRRLASAYPVTNQGRDLLPHVYNFREFFIGPNATLIYEAMSGAVVFVLLIACANLANLMLARAIGRSRETSVRMALGAGRWRIIRQLLVESVMLSCVGGVLGWWIAKWGVHLYALAATGPGLSDAINGTWFDDVLDYAMGYRVLAYLIAISIGTGLLFGLAPALRLSKLDVNAALKDGGRGATGGGRGKRLSALLVTGEMALAIVLLAGAGVMIRSFLKIYNADVGVKTESLLTTLLTLPSARYFTAEGQRSFVDRLKTRLEALPGVESVSIASALPSAHAGRVPYELAGAESAADREHATISSVVVSSDYFRTVGAAVISGREFNRFDAASSAPAVAIVNQRFASEHWPGEAALGKRLRFFNGKAPGPWMTVVGVVSNIVQNDITRQTFDPLVYTPSEQRPAASMWILMRTRGAPGGLASALRGQVQAMDSDLPIALGPFPLAQYLARGYQYRGTSGTLFLIFAAIALLLASVGLYAVIAHSVSQRTQEIGIRIAMGATARDILGLVFHQGMIPLATGLAIGLAGSFAVNRVIKSSLVHVSPYDPLTLMVASSVLILAATLGCLVPARRAMRVDPVVALRHE
jgi:putative ABC transport system permease protein